MADEETSLRSELSHVLKAMGLQSFEFENKEQIIACVEEKFIVGTPRAWWLSLAIKPEVFSYPDNSGFQHILEVAPLTNDEVWFIVDEDNEEKFLFSVPLCEVPRIIEGCRFFEYYIVDKAFSWLLAENDHGDILICR